MLKVGTPASPSAGLSTGRLIALVAGGNVLELYDFAIFGFLARSLATNFFPPGDPIAALLSTFGVYAVGFLGRIAGGLVYGVISDRAGRARALQLSVVLMTLATTALGLLPTYHQVGVVAPLVLTLLRIAQGLSAGGETTSTRTLIAERVGPDRRGLANGLTSAAGSGGFLLGAAVSAICGHALTPVQMERFGWRLPFLGAAVLGLLAYLARRELLRLADAEGRLSAASPLALLREALIGQHRGMLNTIFGVAIYQTAFFVPFTYLATALQETGRQSMGSSLSITSVALFLLCALTPIGGALADAVGMRRLVLGTTAVLGVMSLPIFHLVERRAHDAGALVGLAILVVLYAPLNAIACVPLTLQFPRRVRGTAYSVSYNVGTALFGGVAPLLADVLVRRFGLAAAGWLILGAAPLSLVGFWRSREAPGD